MQIVRAHPNDAATLTAIALAAKRHWQYPEAWMECWREALTIRPEFIAAHETHVALMENRAVGFYALEHKDAGLHLQHLWVAPEWMGRGVGRALFQHGLERARQLGSTRIEIESDPHAEGFYQRMGARRVGSNACVVDGQRRELPVLVCEVTAI